jgi:hypothetical protein
MNRGYIRILHRLVPSTIEYHIPTLVKKTVFQGCGEISPSAPLVAAYDDRFSRARLTDVENVLIRPVAATGLDERHGGGRGGQNSGG